MYYRVHSTKVKVKCWYRTKAEAIAAFDRQSKRAGAPPLDYPPTISGDSITTNDIPVLRACATVTGGCTLMPRTNKEVITDDSEAAARADALVLARGIGGPLPQAAIGTLVDVDYAAEKGMLFRNRHLLLYAGVRLQNA